MGTRISKKEPVAVALAVLLSVVSLVSNGAFGQANSKRTCENLFAPIPTGYQLDRLHQTLQFNWRPVDIDGDGVWELALATEGAPTRVGVFSPLRAQWDDGPHEIPVVNRQWAPFDYDLDGRLEYAYYRDGAVRLYHPQGGVDTHLWDVPEGHRGEAIFWGETSDGKPLVGFNVGRDEIPGPWLMYGSWTVFVYEVLSGSYVRAASGSPSEHRVIYGYPEASSHGLVIHVESRHHDPTPHVGYKRYVESILILGKDWEAVWTIPVVDKLVHGGDGPLDGALLGGFQCARTDQAAYFLFSIGAIYGIDLPSQTAIYAASSTTPLWQVSGFPYVSAASYDLDGDGVDGWALPRSDGQGWHIRALSTGGLLDTIPGMPQVDLLTLPLSKPGECDLFYFSDSSVYMWDYLQTDVKDLDVSTTSLPQTFALFAYPNPFNSRVHLSWDSGVRADRLDILNILGQRVRIFEFDGRTDIGTIEWNGLDRNGRAMPSGIYFARLTGAHVTGLAKLILLK